MKIHAKVYDFYTRLYPMFRNFPKAEKYGICLQIKDMFAKLLVSLTLASNVKSRRVIYLQKSSAFLINLVFHLKLSEHRSYISKGFFKEADLFLSGVSDDINDLFKNKNRLEAVPGGLAYVAQ